MSTIGQRIRELREGRKITSKDLAQALDINPSSFSKLENDKKSIDAEELRKLSQYFNVSADFILGINHEEDLVLYMKENKNLNDAEIEEIKNVIDMMDEAVSIHNMRKRI